MNPPPPVAAITGRSKSRFWHSYHALCFFFSAALSLPAQAQIDTQELGMSDFWQRHFNRDNPGQLFDPQNPAHQPEADPDGDGWTNLQESIAGTDPFDPNPPDGRIVSHITYLKDQEEAPSPEYPDGRIIDIAVISWDTVPGKQYTLLFSPNLTAGSWIAADAPYHGDGLPAAISITLNDSEGFKADKLFWRVQVEDIDSDGDGLTDYEEYHLGTNPFNWDTSGNGVPDGHEFLFSGQFSVWPSEIVSNLHNDHGEQRQILLSNVTDSPVNFTIALENQFGPSYSFQDSITGSATYTWEEISTTGTRLANISNHLDASQLIDLSGFTFPFHGNTFSRIHVSNNGLITVGSASSAFSNQPLPSTSAPANLIAPFWDDLDTRTIGDVYFKEETDRLIIQYENVGRYQGGTNSAYTFQVVLHDDGRIHYRYKSMVGVLNSATVGLQNSTRTIGLQIAYNDLYIADEMAVEISSLSEFFTLSPLEGTVAANSVLSLDAAIQSLQLPPGSYTATLTTTHDATSAPVNPIITQATLHVINDPSDVALTSPASGTSILEGETITLTATASDLQGMAKVEFYSGETKIGEQLAFSPNTSHYSYFWSQPTAGVHTLTAHAIDTFGAVTISAPVTFTVHADANSNGIPDWWELQYFGNLDQTADGDFDGDGLSNLWEYQHQHLGFDPTDPTDATRDTSQNGLPDWWEITHFGAIGGVDASADPDADGLTNLQEFQYGTDPHNWDTDGDLLPDSWEVQYGLNPLDATGDNGADGDPDNDGLNNFKEMVHGTDPLNWDTDGDATSDGDEVDQGSNPNDPSDGGQAPPEDEIQPVKIIVGDPSGSESERWKVEVRDAATQQLIVTHVSREYGALSEEADSIFLLRKQKSYTFNLRWIGTDPEVLEWDPDGDFYPDYDWALEISYQDDEENWVDVTSEDNQRYLVLDPWDPQEKTLATDNVKLLVNRDELEYPWEGHPDRTEQYEQQIVTKQVVLLPIEVVSRDKFLAGSFVIPNGWDSLEMEFIGPDGSLGKYGALLGGGSTKIYDKVEDILADSDYASGSQSSSQKVWFVRNTDDPRRIDYYTCFDSVGEVQIKLYLDSNPDSLEQITHTLTTAEDFAEIIDYVNQWVEGTSFDFSGGVITPPLPMGAMQMNAEGEGGIHNLTRAALIPFFNVVNTVEGLGTIAFGLFDGIKGGLQDDWQLLVLIKDGVLGAGGWAIEAVEEELNKWKDDPLKRAAELKKAADRICQEWVFNPMEQIQTDLSTWEGFKKRSWRAWNSVKGTANKAWVLTKDSWGMIQSGLSDWVNDFADRMMEGAEKAHWSETVFSMDKIQGDINEYTRQASYTFGYTFGYLTEQVAVGILTGGTVKIGAVMAKGGAAFATQLAARRVLPVVGRLQFIKKWAASVAISIEMKMAVERGLIIAAETPLSLAVKDSVGEVIERGMARATFERSAFSTSKVLDEVVSAGNIKKLLLSPGREGQFWYKFAIFFEIMDVKATAAASQGWVKAYNRLLKFSDDIFEEDRAGDLFTLLKIESSATGREIARKSLAEYSANAGEKLWVRDLQLLQSKGYRYVTQYDLDQIASNGGKLPLHPTREGQYFTLDGSFTSGQAAKDKLQLPRPANEYIGRVEFDIAPVNDKIRVPRGDNDTAAWLEPLARDNPSLGEIGGGTQLLLEASQPSVTFIPF